MRKKEKQNLFSSIIAFSGKAAQLRATGLNNKYLTPWNKYTEEMLS